MKEQGLNIDDHIYSDTAYDDAFRTMEGRCDDLLIPFVSHMFKENYGRDAKVKRLRNEQFIEHEDGSEEKRITDSSFEIIWKNVTKRYHLECESKKYDGTLLIRLFEYDSQIAKNTAEGSMYKLKVSIPNSGLLLLRGTDNTPKSAEIEIAMPNERSASYKVPIMKMADYTIDDIFNEHLYMLIPFYIFNYEKMLPDIDSDENQIDKLLSEYSEIFDRLRSEQERGVLSAHSYSAIIKLSHRVAYKLTMKQDKIQKKVGDFMGGKVLDLPEFRIYDEGKAEGLAEGLAEGEKMRKEMASTIEALTARIKELEQQQKDQNLSN
ncbi:hypothetical protein [Butyrivibrio sp. MC2013]|uniref:hypothetical protein n=1 Tax=Butyrivibrio sp. MC2013 TaxID=1280686 RepID=UPI000404BADE|nr:hypothetical protein [Butyrivibrio sp. MC2013]